MPGAPEEVDTTESEDRTGESEPDDQALESEPEDRAVEPDARVGDGEGNRRDEPEPVAGPERNSPSSEEDVAADTSQGSDGAVDETGSSHGPGGHSLTTHERLAVGRSLLVLQQALSERYWGGGWVEGFEYELWEMGASGAALPEDVEIDAAAGAASAEPADLCVLADLCGGWWTWEDGPVFVPLGEWERRIRVRATGEDPRAGAATDAGGVTVPGGVAAQE